MFKLVAVLFLVANGVPSKEPAVALAYHETFKTQKECEDFTKTPDAKAAHKAITQAAKKQSMVVKFTCSKFEDKTV